MKKQISALLLGVTLTLASTEVTHAMSSLVSLSSEPVWPLSSTPDGNVSYNVTTVARAGAGLLEVTLTAGNMPPGVTVTFSPSVLRFTGNQVTSQTATMTVPCPGLIPLDSYAFTLTGTSLRGSVTTTNQVLFSPGYMAIMPPTLYLDSLTNSALRLRGLGGPGKTYQIEATSNLTSPVWTSIGSATADCNGRFTFFTAQVANFSPRYYRAVGP